MASYDKMYSLKQMYNYNRGKACSASPESDGPRLTPGDNALQPGIFAAQPEYDIRWPVRYAILYTQRTKYTPFRPSFRCYAVLAVAQFFFVANQLLSAISLFVSSLKSYLTLHPC
jgi:hypothetical protein